MLVPLCRIQGDIGVPIGGDIGVHDHLRHSERILRAISPGRLPYVQITWNLSQHSYLMWFILGVFSFHVTHVCVNLILIVIFLFFC